MNSLVVVYSSHHQNTKKIADAIAAVLGAPVRDPRQVSPEEVAASDLVGFGSGIYGAKNHASLLGLAGNLPAGGGKKAFIFSTYGAPAVFADRQFVEKNHAPLREILLAKGYTILGEFGCAGWNTNSFLEIFGGLNRGRPDAGDLRNAGEFAETIRSLAGRKNGAI